MSLILGYFCAVCTVLPPPLHWTQFDNGNIDGLAMFWDMTDFCMKLPKAEWEVNQQEGEEFKCCMIWQNDDGFVALKWSAEDREGWRHRERMSKTSSIAEDYWTELNRTWESDGEGLWSTPSRWNVFVTDQDMHSIKCSLHLKSTSPGILTKCQHSDGLSTSSTTECVTWPAQHHVEVHAIDANVGVVLDAQIYVFLDTEAKIARRTEVTFTKLVLFHLHSKQV